MKEFNRSIIISVVAVLIAGLFIPQKYFVNPVRSLTYQATTPITKVITGITLSSKRFFKNFLQLRKISEENQKLEEENANLIVENIKISNLEYENKILREQLNFLKKHGDLKLVGTSVIAKDPESFLQIITISAGEQEGIETGQAVILNYFLVGKIEEVYEHHSRVLLITNRESVINALVLDSRASGVVVGELGFGLVIESVPQDADIKLQDQVITSELGKNIPQGLVIGEISEIISDESEIFKRASLTSPIDFANLEIVFVVTGF